MSDPFEPPGTPASVVMYAYAEAPEPEIAEWDFPLVDAEGRGVARKRPAVSPPSAPPAADPGVDFARRLAEEAKLSFEAGRQQGIEEGRAAEQAATVPAEQHRAEQVRRMMESFAGERDRYLHAVEQEVVRLALAVAARVLRRESQMDPLLLLGAARVGLGQLAAGTDVRLHVPAADVELWKEAIALVPNPPVRPVVMADEAMRLGDCRIETSLGRADLGLDAQMGEIEQRFFPRAPAAEPDAGRRAASGEDGA